MLEQSDVGAHLDGVTVLHRRERFPVAGTRAERRAERAVALCFVLCAVGAVAFAVVYVAVPWRYGPGASGYVWYTPLLGATMALSLLGFGLGAILWAKLLITEEESVQQRHGGRSDEVDPAHRGGAAQRRLGDDRHRRRSLLQRTLGLSVLALGGLAIIPLGGLIKKPGDQLFRTAWREGVPLMTADRRLVRPGDLQAGGIATVFPGTSDGLSTQVVADSVVLLIRLGRVRCRCRGRARRTSAGRTTWPTPRSAPDAGCPASLYEQQTGRLPAATSPSLTCYRTQSPFWEPAARPLPKLAITVDDEGYFVAKHDFLEPIGPSFWERP